MMYEKYLPIRIRSTFEVSKGVIAVVVTVSDGGSPSRLSLEDTGIGLGFIMDATNLYLDVRRLAMYQMTSRRHQEGKRMRKAPGKVRDAILRAFKLSVESSLSNQQLHALIEKDIGQVAASSVRSYLQINEGKVFRKVGRGKYTLAGETK